MSARPWRIEVTSTVDVPEWLYISSAASEAGAREAGRRYRYWWPAVRLVNRDIAEVVAL